MAKKSLKATSDDGKSKNLMKSDDPKTFAKYLDAIPGNHVKSNQEIFYILYFCLIAYFNNHYTTLFDSYRCYFRFFVLRSHYTKQFTSYA